MTTNTVKSRCEEVKRALVDLAYCLGYKDLTARRVDLYADRLGKYDADIVLKAISKGQEELRFFPQLVDLKELMNSIPIKHKPEAQSSQTQDSKKQREAVKKIIAETIEKLSFGRGDKNADE